MAANYLMAVRCKSEQVIVYKAGAQVCNCCPVKHECTESKSGRHIFRSFFQEYVDRVRAYHDTEEYQHAMRKRGVWVEPLFGEAKQFHRLRRFRLRRLQKVNIEGLMVAAGQNIKRLLKHGTRDMVSGRMEGIGELLNLFRQLLSQWFIPFQYVYSIRFSTGWISINDFHTRLMSDSFWGTAGLNFKDRRLMNPLLSNEIDIWQFKNMINHV